MSVELRAFDASARLKEQRELFNDAFPENRGGDVASVEHYRWKFHQYPAAVTSYEYEASSTGVMLGYYAAIPYRYRSNRGEDATVAMVCDVMTHSSARGQGIFTKIGKYATEQMAVAGLSFALGYPIRPEVLPGHLKVGWRVVQELPIYLRPLRGAPLMHAAGIGLLAPLAHLGVAFFSLIIRLIRSLFKNSDLKVRCGSVYDLINHPGYCEFLSRWGSNLTLALKKDPEFMRWRFGAPGTEYTVFFIERGTCILASAIVRETVLSNVHSLAILDLMLDGHESGLFGSGPVSAALFQALEDYAADKNVSAIAIMINRYWAKRSGLWRNGFIRTPHVFKLIAKQLKDPLPVFAESSVHPQWIDSDDL